MADFNSKYSGEQVEELLDMVANGEVGGGIEAETDPIFSASPAASITDAKKAEWDAKQDKITDLDAIREGASLGATALQFVPSEYITETELNNKGYATTSSLNDKVDKVSGKQLSTEDFTSVLKSKLEGLNNYDDTELSNALSTLRGDFDKLVSGDTTTAIKTFNEVIAFLDGITDTEDLAGIIASIEQQIAGKQDKLVSGTNIKTINGTSILGSGDITISGGSGGSSGGGSKEFVEFETEITPVGYDGIIQLAQMNKIYVSDKPLTYMFIAELESGIEGEVSFHFVASKEGCTLGLPSGVIWANGKVPDNPLTDCYCELSIVAVKNINTYIYKAVLSTIPYGHNVVLQAGDNGQIGVDTYNYMVSHGVTDAVGTIDWTAAIEDNILLNADGLDNQRLERASISPGDPSRWFSLRWIGQLYWVAYLRPDGYLDIDYDD